MNKLIIKTLCCFFVTTFSFSQTIQDIINEVNLDSLQLTLREFTGEQTTVVNGNTVTILNREEDVNDLAADYLVQKFNRMDNLSVSTQPFNTNGINVIATQTGKTNPNDIYLICAHYDSKDDYSADDNASGTATILEIARILSTQCLDNTIVYALWDEEENGLNGSRYYAINAVNNGDNILGVLNIDMMAYDGDNDQSFDIDIKQGDAGSITMGNDIVNVLNTYTFNLNVNIVIPGTEYSDHSNFWDRGFPAVLVGEAWSEGDESIHYHLDSDRYDTLNFPYYHELAKLIMGYMVTKGSLVNVDNTVTQTVLDLTANQNSASYQWIDCDTNLPISGAINQTYTPIANGNYAVEITSGSCVELSACIDFNTLGLEEFEIDEISVYPNPVKTNLKIEVAFDDDFELALYDVLGKLIMNTSSSKKLNALDLSKFTSGIYFLEVSTSEKSSTYKIIKE